MKVIPIQSLKGGTGKTQICAGLGRALAALGYRVGFVDVDWIAPNLHLQLGMDSDAELVLNAEGVGDLIKPLYTPQGFPIISSSFIFPPDQAISMDEESTIQDVQEITSNGVVDWGDLDYLLMDTPPTTSRFITAALSIPNMSGVVLVVQPSASAMADLMRVVSLLEDQRVPVIGLIGNQTFVVCDHCAHCVTLYELSEDDIRDFCHHHKIPYLGSIPHIPPDQCRRETELFHLRDIARQVVETDPVVLQPQKVGSMPYKLLMALAKRRRESKQRKVTSDG